MSSADKQPATPPADTRTGTAETRRGRYAWVPIRSLGPQHRTRVEAHLVQLATHDRYLRFGYAANDAQIARYVAGIDFGHDEVFGIFNRRLELIAVAHLAYGAASNSEGRGVAEFGVSVLSKARGRGFGARLFEHAVLHARNRGVDTLIIHALTENAAMLRIARNAGARVQRDGSESQARLKLEPESLASHVEQLVGDQAAEFDYRLKRHARRSTASSATAGGAAAETDAPAADGAAASTPPVPGDAAGE